MLNGTDDITQIETVPESVITQVDTKFVSQDCNCEEDVLGEDLAPRVYSEGSECGGYPGEHFIDVVDNAAAPEAYFEEDGTSHNCTPVENNFIGGIHIDDTPQSYFDRDDTAYVPPDVYLDEGGLAYDNMYCYYEEDTWPAYDCVDSFSDGNYS